MITGWHSQTPSKSEFLCLWQVGETVRGNGKRTWRRESLRRLRGAVATLSGRLAAFSAKSDVETKGTYLPTARSSD